MKHLWITIIILSLLATGCKPKKEDSNQRMVELLKTQAHFANDYHNEYAPQAILNHIDSLIRLASINTDLTPLYIQKGKILLQLGREQRAVNLLDSVLHKTFIIDYLIKQKVISTLALAYLRLGERTNCIHNHSAESCLFPVSGGGIHQDKYGSQKAIELYQQLLKADPDDYEARWLLNLAYMTTGEYPQKVPAAYLVSNPKDNPQAVQPFKDVAMQLGLAVKKISGGSIIDDFDNDGYPDIVTSSSSLAEHMHYFHNNHDGSFTDRAEMSGLGQFTGGLNMMQTDYNNDGLKDIFVLRGAWKGKFGKEPNSLLRNNGDGTFTDVTEQSGLLSFHPTQTATWADFNNDGWLDVFIGNESATGDDNPSELYVNNKNGTFTEISKQAGCHINLFVKGVTSGDYDNDGLPDLYLSTMNGTNVLFKNVSKNKTIRFQDVTRQASLSNQGRGTFSTWFWDYDNDGRLDLLACSYTNDLTIGYVAGMDALNKYGGKNGKVILYHNEGSGHFKDVSEQAGFTHIAFAMGANFGDIDNDGYPDFYLGTGNPLFSSLVPNRLYKNNAGKFFTDVTVPARVGNLQKGHAVSFADLDNDGFQDIYINLGGAFIGDAYQNALYLNPASNHNNWLELQLEGVQSNRAAVGAKLRISFTEHGVQRSVYRIVNSGGSFGANPLRQHIGLGSATGVDEVQITWPVTGKVQEFRNLKAGSYLRIKENSNQITTFTLAKFDFNTLPAHAMAGMKM
jgi:hypothetical protein